MIAHNRMPRFWLLMILVSLLTEACAQEPPVRQMEQAIWKHNDRINSIVSRSTADVSPESLAALWQECQQLRDLEGAGKLADSASMTAKPFWKGCFALLSGKKEDRLPILEQAESKDVSADSETQVIKSLFSQEQLREAKLPALEPLMEELRNALRIAEKQGNRLADIDGALTARHFNEELFTRLIAEPKERLDHKLLASLALSAFAACHYDDGAELYKRYKEEVGELPKQYRNVLGCGMDMFFLAYFAQKPIMAEGKDGWLLADGIEVQVAPTAGSVRWKLLVLQAKRETQKRKTHVIPLSN